MRVTPPASTDRGDAVSCEIRIRERTAAISGYREWMGSRAGVLFVLVLLTGCTKRNPIVCCTTSADCAAQGLPAGSMCSDGQLCVQNECTFPTNCQANSDCMEPTPLCTPDGLCGECLDSSTCGDRVCDTETHVCRGCSDDSECATGFCSPVTETCQPGTITPRYLPSICELPATNDLHVVVDTTFADPDCNGGIVVQSGGPSICVVRYRMISVAGAVTLAISSSQALALVADESLTIDGILDVSASGTIDGGGGGYLVSGGGASASASSGGGGAGFNSVGGPGGDATTGGAANGGGTFDVVGATVLMGGARSAGSLAGGGGGAVTLISCRGTVTVNGLIDAGGGGAKGGASNSPGPNGGWGGGAGGNIVLQGRAIDVTGQLYANGGGGGGGKPDTTNSAIGGLGEDGGRSLACASGGIATRGASGGAGGCGGLLPQAGDRYRVDASSTSAPSGGGGGGSVGFLQTYTPAGIAPNVHPSAVSPDFLPNGTIPTH